MRKCPNDEGVQNLETFGALVPSLKHFENLDKLVLSSKSSRLYPLETRTRLPAKYDKEVFG